MAVIALLTFVATLPVFVTAMAMPLTEIESMFVAEPAVMAAVVPVAVAALAVAVKPVIPELLIAVARAAASPLVEAPSETELVPTTIVEAPVAPTATLFALAPVYWPSTLVRALETAETVIVWPTLAPTWKAAPENEPSSRFTPLNWVVFATLSMSALSCWNC